MTLTEFLLARIAEDEAPWLDVPTGAVLKMQWVEPERQAVIAPQPVALLTAARVLAECEAKRQIVAELGDYDDGYVWASGEGSRARSALEALAQPYAEHPDYDPAWAIG